MTSLPHRICMFDGCNNPRDSQGYCKSHYAALRYRGELQLVQPRYKSLEDAFWRHVPKGRPEECWEWASARNSRGYGVLTFEKRQRLATHVSWYLHKRQWPSDLGKYILHACDNPACVNPEHLSIGTQAANLQDMFSKGRGHRSKGASHHSAKLAESAVLSIRSDAASGVAHQLLAERFGVSRRHIWDIVNRRSWRHLE